MQILPITDISKGFFGSSSTTPKRKASVSNEKATKKQAVGMDPFAMPVDHGKFSHCTKSTILMSFVVSE